MHWERFLKTADEVGVILPQGFYQLEVKAFEQPMAATMVCLKMEDPLVTGASSFSLSKVSFGGGVLTFHKGT